MCFVGILSDYKEYKKFEPQYENWKIEKDTVEAKRLKYLKNFNIDYKTKQESIQKGKVVLRAIDVMDEYSQSRAEDTEIITDQMKSQVGFYSAMVGAIPGGLFLASETGKNFVKTLCAKFPKVKQGTFFQLLGGVFTFIPIFISFAFMEAWASKKEVEASKKGRLEAMKKELSDARNFAVLNEDQKAKVEEIAANMPVTKDMKKGTRAKNSNMLNPFDGLKLTLDMFKSSNLQKERDAFNEALTKNEDKNKILTEKDIEDAKKDQQLLHNVVEKIDMASQDYSENAELAISAFSTILLAGGSLVTLALDKIMNTSFVKNLPKGLQNRLLSFIPLAASIGLAVYTSNVQKEASRVGRYLAKKELEKDLDNFIYVDDEKAKNIKINDIKQKKKPGFFKFLTQVFKDHKEYKNYIKNENVENIKKQRALKGIELTPDQLKEAKRLQKNTFKIFDKLDEKSQKYSESTEAFGNIVFYPILTVCSMIGTSIGMLFAKINKGKTDIKVLKETEKIAHISRASLPIFIGSVLGAIPAIIANTYITKQQKQASRVAHMLALDEMKDYKNYADYNK